MVDHLLLHCSVVSELWNFVFRTLGIHWVLLKQLLSFCLYGGTGLVGIRGIYGIWFIMFDVGYMEYGFIMFDVGYMEGM